jgi:hypothetical protein
MPISGLYKGQETIRIEYVTLIWISLSHGGAGHIFLISPGNRQQTGLRFVLHEDWPLKLRKYHL